MQSEQLLEAALGVSSPWYVRETQFDVQARTLTVGVDFRAGSRFSHPQAAGEHPVHDTQTKRYRHLNFFQHECFLEVRVPRVKLPDGSVRLIEPPWAGKLSGFTLLFEALVLCLCREMPFAAVARLVGESWHRVARIAERYVELALAEELTAHGGDPEAIEAVSIDMSPAYIKGVASHLPNASVTFDKFHVIVQASHALDLTRRAEQKRDPDLKGLRWALLKDRSALSAARRSDLDALLKYLTTKRTARAWQYREDLREILKRKQINVVRDMLRQWCTNVMRSKVEPMKVVARISQSPPRVHRHMDQDANDQRLLGSSERLVPGRQAKSTRLSPAGDHPIVIFLIAGKLDFRMLNPHAA